MLKKTWTGITFDTTGGLEWRRSGCVAWLRRQRRSCPQSSRILTSSLVRVLWKEPSVSTAPSAQTRYCCWTGVGGSDMSGFNGPFPRRWSACDEQDSALPPTPTGPLRSALHPSSRGSSCLFGPIPSRSYWFSQTRSSAPFRPVATSFLQSGSGALIGLLPYRDERKAH